MKKILLLSIVLLSFACSNNTQKGYRYVEILIKDNGKDIPADTLKFGKAFLANNNEEAYLKAYEIFYTNFIYLLDLECGILPETFILKDGIDDSIIKNIDFPHKAEAEAEIRIRLVKYSSMGSSANDPNDIDPFELSQLNGY